MEIQSLLLLVQRRVRDSERVQLFGDSHQTHAADEFLIYHPHDLCGFIVDNELVIIVGIFHVAVTCKRTDEFSLSAVIIQRSANGHARHRRIALINDIRYADGNAARRGVHVVVGGIHAIVQRDESHVFSREIVVNQVAADGVIPAEAVQILDDNAIDQPAFNIRFQPCEAGAVKVCACKSVVNIDIKQLHLRVLPQIFQQDFTLVRDGHRLVSLLQILFGEANVKGSAPSLYRSLRLPCIIRIFIYHFSLRIE